MYRFVCRLTGLAAICLLLPALAPESRAQAPAGNRGVGILVEGQVLQPVGALSDRFGTGFSGALGIGRWTSSDTYMEVRLQRFAFSKADEIDFAESQGRPQISQDSLDLSLDILGGGCFVRRTLTDGGALRPFIAGGVGLYHWTDVRGSYTGWGLNLPEEERGQWSAGFHAGLGTEVAMGRQLAVHLGVDYTIVMGELWPTLALNLENVSTFHFATGRLGLRYFF